MIIFPYYVILKKMRLRGNVLAEIYNYYYIGEEMAGSGAEFMSSPVLLTFSKIKNGPPEEQPADGGGVFFIYIGFW